MDTLVPVEHANGGRGFLQDRRLRAQKGESAQADNTGPLRCALAWPADGRSKNAGDAGSDAWPVVQSVWPDRRPPPEVTRRLRAARRLDLSQGARRLHEDWCTGTCPCCHWRYAGGQDNLEACHLAVSWFKASRLGELKVAAELS